MARNPSAASRKLYPELLKVLIWPALALVVVIVIVVTGGFGSAQNVELGPLKVSFARDLDRTVGAPPAEIAGLLTRLTPQDMEILISHGKGAGRPICTIGNFRRNLPTPIPQDQQDEANGYARLIAAGLVELGGPGSGDTTWCTQAGLRLAWLTRSGTQVRTYLVDLLTRSLVISRS